MNRDDLVRGAQAEQADSQLATRPWRDVIRTRVFIALAVLAIWAVVVVARLAHLQIVQHDMLVAYMAKQVADTEVLPGLRGRILDRHGATLAVTVQGDMIVADPQVLTEPGQKLSLEGAVARLCAVVAGCDTGEQARMIDLLRAKNRRRYVILWRDASPADAQRVTELSIRGIFLERESRRFYPNRELASHVVGHVNSSLHGLTGVEFSQDANIRGRDGKRLVFLDGRRHGYDSRDLPATMGNSVELTIDRTLQLIAERELAAGIKEYNAKGAVAIILDPWTGEILAAASEPAFNPNAFTEQSLAHQRNRAAQDLYEPGSTFKIVTASTAIDTKTCTPDTPVNVAGGSIRIGARVVNDVHAYSGSLSLRDVIVKSSNVGAIRIGFGVGAQKIAEYARLFGFGWLTAKDLPFASRGAILKPTDTWSLSALASVSMGYQVACRPMQMAAAASTIANGGVLYQPHAVRALIVNNERRPVARQAAAPCRSPRRRRPRWSGSWKASSRKGTAKAARIPGYTIAGKTGTARKVAEGRRGYTDDYNASFVGFIPSREPVFTILVVVDSPKGEGLLRRIGRRAHLQAHRRSGPALPGVSPNVDPDAHGPRDRREARRAGSRGADGRGAASRPRRRARRRRRWPSKTRRRASMPNLRHRQRQGSRARA